MGLNCSHGAWRGAHSAFHKWRIEIAGLIGIPLELMEGFYNEGYISDSGLELAMDWIMPRNGGPLCGDYRGSILYHYIESVRLHLPLQWEMLRPNPLHILLHHSDCDGYIAPEDCRIIADRLQELIRFLPKEKDPGHIGYWDKKTQTFIDGLRSAASANEPLLFR